MDVYCAACGEPYEAYHMQHDEIDDVAPDEADTWHSLPTSEKLNDHFRTLFRRAGWELGGSVLNIHRCPCCPKDATPDAERLMKRRILEDLLGDDEDAMLVMMEDYAL